MREQLLAQVGARIARFTADRDVDLVLDPAAQEEVRALLEVAVWPGPDLEVLSLAGWLHWFRYLALDADSDQNDLRLAVTLFEEVYRVQPESVPTRIGSLLDGLGSGSSDDGERYFVQGFAALQHAREVSGIALSGIAVDWLRKSVVATPSDHPDRSRRLSILGLALQSLFELTWSAKDLDDAITVGQDAVAATSPDDPDRAGRLSDLGVALKARYDLAKSAQDLDDAITVRRKATAATSPDGPDRARRLSDLGVALKARYDLAKSTKDLDNAITVYREAVTATADCSDSAEFLSDLGLALRSLFTRTRSTENLNDAIKAFREAVAAIPSDHPERVRYLANLGLALQTRFERIGSTGDLEETVYICREVLSTAPDDHPDRASFLSQLGAALHLRFDHEESAQDLAESITVGQDAVNAASADDPDRPMYLMNLGLAFQSGFGRTGSAADLDQAVDVLRDAATAASTAGLHRAVCLSNVALALRIRFESRGSIEDLEEAVAVGRDAAVAATPGDDLERAMSLSNLSVALQLRFKRTKSVDDLAEAVSIGRDAVAAIPADHRLRQGILANFAVSLRLRFEQTGSIDDLEEAVAMGREALATVRVDDPIRGRYLSNLSLDLLDRFRHIKSIADIDEAVFLLRAAAAAVPVDHPDRAICLSNLSLVLQDRFDFLGSVEDLDGAVIAGRKGFHSNSAPTRMRVRAAVRWGSSAAKRELWGEAVRAYAAAIGLLGELVPRDMERADQESLLEVIASIGTDAAACAVRANQPGRAAELFEQGRGVLLGYALDDRTDLTALSNAHPDLAGRYVELRDLLDAPAGSSADGRFSDDGGKTSESREGVGRRRRTQRAEFHQLIARIQNCEGFDAFLASPKITELAAAAGSGPVVLVTASEFTSYAVIITARGIEDTIELAALTPAAVLNQVLPFVGALGTVTSPTATTKEKMGAESQINGTLEWVWDTLAGPVVCLLDSRGLLGDGGRVWWCLSGLLSFLPVHASGHHGTRSDSAPSTVMDRTVSSYTPTLRTLIYARRDRPVENISDGSLGPVLVAAMPTTPNASPLPGVTQETAALAERMAGRVIIRKGPEVTFDKIRALLPKTEWAHFACHGASYLDHPSDSHLLFQDHLTRPFTVVDVAQLQLDHAWLAYLSACSTARPSGRLTDEAIHLASAFQLAGYRHVIGTLWPVSDSMSVWLTSEIYKALTQSDPVSPAVAVHAATKRLRNEYPDRPSLWSSHMHIGA